MKFDLFYQLPSAASQNPSARYRELVAEAVEADRLGFDTLWLAEVHFTPRFSVMPAPLLQLAAIAERTTRLRLGIGLTCSPCIIRCAWPRRSRRSTCFRADE